MATKSISWLQPRRGQTAEHLYMCVCTRNVCLYQTDVESSSSEVGLSRVCGQWAAVPLANSQTSADSIVVVGIVSCMAVGKRVAKR